jgi:hypothetical protein
MIVMNYALIVYIIILFNACGNIKTMSLQERPILLDHQTQEIVLPLDISIMKAGEFIEIPMSEVINPDNQNLSFLVFLGNDQMKTEIGSFALYPNTQPFNYIIDTKSLKSDSLGIRNIYIKSKDDLLSTTKIKFLPLRKFKPE